MPLNAARRIALAAVAVSLAACHQGPPSETTAPQTAPAPVPAVESTPAVAPARDIAAALLANQWQLTAATDASGQAMPALFPAESQPLGIAVADGRLNVTGSCNRISAGYQLLEGAQMQVSAGPSTMMACPQPLADADAAIAGFLSGILQVSITGETDAPSLQLTSADGKVLTFSGTPTPETRFGGPGARAFLEVSPQPCAAPAASPCLMVRDRDFDDNGLVRGTLGEWRALPQGIEGYARVDGEQHVVRVKRFEKAGVDGNASTQHFVFDLLVETRTVE